jgi:hypothetical protein
VAFAGRFYGGRLFSQARMVEMLRPMPSRSAVAPPRDKVVVAEFRDRDAVEEHLVSVSNCTCVTRQEPGSVASSASGSGCPPSIFPPGVRLTAARRPRRREESSLSTA